MLAPSQHDFLVTMANDKAFFKALGLRPAALRKEAGLSQQAIADHLGIAQQTLAHYEVGTARMPVSIVPAFAKLYGVDANELLGLQNGAGKRGPAPQLEITWDTAKAQSNLAKHGVTFAQATTVLLDPLAVTVFDAAHSQEEQRWFTLGALSDGKLLTVAHTYQQTDAARHESGLFQRGSPHAANVSSTRVNRDRQ